MLTDVTLGGLAMLSSMLMVWQWAAARRFPLHARPATHPPFPAVTLLKPLKGTDPETEGCLRSWFSQDYRGAVQILFGVESEADPVCEVVRGLQREHPSIESELLVCDSPLGANAKVAKLAALYRHAKHEVVVISDADVLAPPHLLSDLMESLRPNAGLVCCFYRFSGGCGVAELWERVAVNVDFWSQVLQARSLRPMDFALGAVIAAYRARLDEVGGFDPLLDFLADDYQLGNRIAKKGHQVELCRTVVECRSAASGWGAVWKHQVRWARTIRVSQPLPYFLSVLSNGTFWPLCWGLVHPAPGVLAVCLGALGLRILLALNLQARMEQRPLSLPDSWIVLLKDLLQMVVWLNAFLGNRIEWRGQVLRLRRGGRLESW